MSRLAVFLLTACLGASAMAADVIDPNRTKEFGDITVRYNTFTSSFLQPETAQKVGVVRSKEKGLINVTVIKGVTPVAAQVTGTIKDLGGKSEILTFKQVEEKGGISYLAPYSVTQREYKTFTINVETGGKAHGFQFNQELFPAE
ncbi:MULTISPECIES: DUF4426 domain-containing protein [Pseudomonas]|uniref:DUF4426 domain-containing protein n=1 Tax=Pseudomonas poae TaxID=200451 RepID=A0AAP2WIJ1_9PSED|nr:MULTISPECIES: DUF4426 domain-containing protein [Pseudomonas]ELQ16351.1 hypothetical protein A986_13577 [Pseudomonas fluorescens BRIP34879]KTC36520.1 homoserine acetyltransferase [Pseudomonas sp. ABAC21]AGE27915.1 hypothetical protein H045_19265 [Pseudomonas poae RE*1-1-14]KRP53943.1 homoserine acetyltransferase [Pseudomonas poae]MBC3196731.1 DUF4426 domain-containing protein [Pseudomonas poae]